MYHFGMNRGFLAVLTSPLPAFGAATRGWLALLEVFAYLMFFKLVGKFEAYPMMRRARMNRFSASVGSIFLLAVLKVGLDWHKLDTYERKGVVAKLQ